LKMQSIMWPGNVWYFSSFPEYVLIESIIMPTCVVSLSDCQLRFLNCHVISCLTDNVDVLA